MKQKVNLKVIKELHEKIYVLGHENTWPQSQSSKTLQNKEETRREKKNLSLITFNKYSLNAYCVQILGSGL